MSDLYAADPLSVFLNALSSRNRQWVSQQSRERQLELANEWQSANTQGMQPIAIAMGSPDQLEQDANELVDRARED
ncbi:hypothetical protein [Streptomyces sp. XD-27]|uniref:hypothetical protein n=1 Tax=Streptomyces sp. XD-27 TaxID=3062779 RepID=UPI0026F41967|nr:hypothetical protein [Streptomyces sp. XD-27]WKX70783.1 hypothetical protein Q3Y56_13485 [Streptomyces sp. XD-27]